AATPRQSAQVQFSSESHCAGSPFCCASVLQPTSRLSTGQPPTFCQQSAHEQSSAGGASGLSGSPRSQVPSSLQRSVHLAAKVQSGQSQPSRSLPSQMPSGPP